MWGVCVGGAGVRYPLCVFLSVFAGERVHTGFPLEICFFFLSSIPTPLPTVSDKAFGGEG